MVDLKFSVQRDYFVKFLSSLSVLGSEASMVLSNDKLFAYMNHSGTAMLWSSLKTDVFDLMELESDVFLTFNVVLVHKTLKKSKVDSVDVHIVDNAISFNYGKSNLSVPLVSDVGIKEDLSCNFLADVSFTADYVEFCDWVSSAKDFSTDLKFVLADGDLNIFAQAHQATSKWSLLIRNEFNVVTSVVAKYALSFLNYVSCFKDIPGDINISFGTDSPIVFRGGDSILSVVYAIAPRVENN